MAGSGVTPGEAWAVRGLQKGPGVLSPAHAWGCRAVQSRALPGCTNFTSPLGAGSQGHSHTCLCDAAAPSADDSCANAAALPPSGQSPVSRGSLMTLSVSLSLQEQGWVGIRTCMCVLMRTKWSHVTGSPQFSRWSFRESQGSGGGECGEKRNVAEC